MKFNKVKILLIVVLPLFAFCSGGSALRFEKLGNTTAGGDWESAISDIRKNAKKLYGKNNQLLYHADLGMLFHYSGKYDSSNTHLLQATRIFDDLFTRSVTNEAASFMVNDNVRPYRSRPYELVLIHQIIALNFLASGNVEGALIESRQVDLLMQELDRKDKSGSRYTTDPMFHYLTSIAYDAAGRTDDAMISLYKAVEAFRAGPQALPKPIADYAARMFIRNNRPNDVKTLGLDTSKAAQGPQNGASEIVLVGYAGRGPVFEENRWWGTFIKDGILMLNFTGADGTVQSMNMRAPALPQAEYDKASRGEKTASGTTLHISFALPAIKKLPSATSSFSLKGASLPDAGQSIVLNDLNIAAQKNLDDMHSATLMRTVVRVALRTIAAEKAKNKMNTENPFANLLINILTDAVADQLESADTRSCFLVPRTIQIVRVPVDPGTYTFQGYAFGRDGSIIETKMFENVQVKRGEKKIVFYSSFK